MNLENLIKSKTVQNQVVKMSEKMLLKPLDELLNLIETDKNQKAILMVFNQVDFRGNKQRYISLILLEGLTIKKRIITINFENLLKQPTKTVERAVLEIEKINKENINKTV